MTVQEDAEQVEVQLRKLTKREGCGCESCVEATNAEVALARLVALLNTQTEALTQTYELLGAGEPQDALHALDAFLIRHGLR